MTIIRLGQLSGDERFPGAHISEELSGDNERIVSGGYTGNYGYRSLLTEGPMGLGFSPVSQIRAGFWMFNSKPNNISGSAPIFRIRAIDLVDVTDYYKVGWDANEDNLILTTPDTTLDSVSASSVNMTKYEVWQHMGVHFKGGAGGFFSFYLNGRKALTYLGDNLPEMISACFATGSDNSGQTWVTDAMLDDFYVDSTEGEEDGPAPALRFYPSLPNGSGEDHEWLAAGESSTYQCVQNAPPLETELAYTNAAGEIDTHLMGNVSLLGQQIHAVIPYVICRKTGPTIDSTITVHLFDGTLYRDSAELEPGVGMSLLWDRQDTKPDASEWDETAANAIEMGYTSAGDYS